MLTVGTEWLIEASGCDAEALRDVGRLREVFARAVRELGLRVVGEPQGKKGGAEESGALRNLSLDRRKNFASIPAASA